MNDLLITSLVFGHKRALVLLKSKRHNSVILLPWPRRVFFLKLVCWDSGSLLSPLQGRRHRQMKLLVLFCGSGAGSTASQRKRWVWDSEGKRRGQVLSSRCHLQSERRADQRAEIKRGGLNSASAITQRNRWPPARRFLTPSSESEVVWPVLHGPWSTQVFRPTRWTGWNLVGWKTWLDLGQDNHSSESS